jgi:SAM-dependent methyltransferase
MYYAKKIEILKDIFAEETIRLEKEYLAINGMRYPIVDDVIILLDPSQYSKTLARRLMTYTSETKASPSEFAQDIQYTFSEEWQKFPKILPEHQREFLQYFDLMDLATLKDTRICDLGCGMGRWSYFLTDKCRELILVDFSDAIFIARRNLAHSDNVLFFMGDLKQLPFREDFADFIFCLGVLHHLPTSALDEIKRMRKYAPKLLVYLYYSLDNRPRYFRALLSLVTILRKEVSKYKNNYFRGALTWIGTIVYKFFVIVGNLVHPFGISHKVPLYETYHGKSLERIRQDVYDRFFTSIEQRYSKKEIMELEDTFSQVIISDRIPYWHFVCQR